MSRQIIKNECFVCKNPLPLESEDNIIFIKRGNLVNYHKEQWKEHYMVKDGYSRVKFICKGKPDGGIHQTCWENLVMSYKLLLYQMKEEKENNEINN